VPETVIGSATWKQSGRSGLSPRNPQRRLRQRRDYLTVHIHTVRRKDLVLRRNEIALAVEFDRAPDPGYRSLLVDRHAAAPNRPMHPSANCCTMLPRALGPWMPIYWLA